MNRRLARTLVNGWIAFAALGVGCGKDDSLGNDRDDELPAAGKGGNEAASGGTTGGRASGGRFELAGGEGGASVEPASTGGATGGSAPATGGTVSATGGTAPGTGGAAETGGTAPVTGGATAAGGTPEPAGGSGGADDSPLDLDDLNTNCVDDACPAALEPVHFYGIAGMNGPEFCMCVITCDAESDTSVCPDGTRCQYIADGPGEVCWET